MIEGRIKTIDAANRALVLTTPDNQEIPLTFPAGANIEVTEPCTMGTMGGDLEDLKEGYYVEVELAPPGADGICVCTSLISVS